jgi:hypothetical protein
MGLASPLLLLGLAALAVPVLVHLVQRMERRGEAFPSLMFVTRTPYQARRRKTLRDRALLALRCLALVLLVLAFAGPEFRSLNPPQAAAADSPATVLLIDRSYSMQAPARWEAALEEAGRRIAALPAGARMALVAFDDDAHLLVPFTGQQSVLRQRLDGLQPAAYGGTRFAAGFDLATRLLRQSGASERRIVLISDLQRSALAAADRLYLDASVTLEPVSIAADVAANAAIMAVSLRQSTAASGPELDIRVRNTGAEALAGVEVALQIEGRTVHRQRLALDAGAERRLPVPVALAPDRASTASVTLGDDDLAADNVHHLVLAPDPPVAATLVAGTSGAGLFLERALAVVAAPSVRVTPLRQTALDDAAVAGTDVLLADASALDTGAAADAVTAHVQGGGSALLILTGEPPAATLDGALALLRPTGPMRRHADPGLGIVLATGIGGHPLWERAGEDIAAALAGTRVRLSVSLSDDGEVLARLSDGTPWLVERRLGAGRMVVMASGIDWPWSNLALEPGFVPLLHELIRHLAQRPPVPVAHALGEVIDLQRLAAAHPGGGSWRQRRGAGAEFILELPDGGQRRLAADVPLYRSEQAGLHQAHMTGAGARTLRFAVNPDRAESLLAGAGTAALMERISQRPQPAASGIAGVADIEQAPSPLGWYLIAAALALLWLESQLANRLSWRRQQAPAGG